MYDLLRFFDEILIVTGYINKLPTNIRTYILILVGIQNQPIKTHAVTDRHTDRLKDRQKIYDLFLCIINLVHTLYKTI